MAQFFGHDATHRQHWDARFLVVSVFFCDIHELDLEL
jgi:hypothetical protein